jgi:predicted nucleic acid-binding OB-fold protein
MIPNRDLEALARALYNESVVKNVSINNHEQFIKFFNSAVIDKIDIYITKYIRPKKVDEALIRLHLSDYIIDILRYFILISNTTSIKLNVTITAYNQ